MSPTKNPLHSTLSALQAAEARMEQLRTKALSVRVQVLKDLHVQLGFASRRDLAEALLELDGGGRATPRAAPTPSTSTRRKRARITPEMRIIEAVKAGDAGAAVAKRFGVSVQTVQNVKKAAGLVRKRK